MNALKYTAATTGFAEFTTATRRLITVAALALTVVASAGCSGSGDKATAAGGGSASTTDPGSISGQNEDWLEAVCQPGRYVDGSPLSGAIGGGYCLAATGMGPVLFTQWDSNFKMRNAMKMRRQCYASSIDSSGFIQTFSTMASTESSLTPLTRFGFSVSC